MKEQSTEVSGLKIQIETSNNDNSGQVAETCTAQQIGNWIGAIIAANAVFDTNQSIYLTVETCNEIFERQETVFRVVKNNNPELNGTNDYTRNYWI